MLFRLLILSCLYLVLSGCSSDDPTRNNTFVPLTSIAVTGTYETMADQTVNQYRAIGNFSGSFTRDITTEVSWSIEDEIIASISNDTGSQGLATALSPGETSVTAWQGDISGSAPLIVKDVSLTAIEITPQAAELPTGTSQQYEAVGTFSDSSTQDITVLATWESAEPNVATIDNTGLVTTLSSGSTTITGTWQDVAASSNLQVTEATLSAIAITPEVTKIAQGTTVQFQAEGIYTDGESRDFTGPLDWQSADNSIAVVDRNGLVEGIAPGQVEISASFDNDGTTLSDTFVLTITGAVIESIKVTPENSTIQAGETLQYTATGTFSDNTQRDITRDVTWLSSDSTVGSISNSSVSRGLFTSIGAGTTYVEAFFNNIGDDTLLIVE